MTDRRRGLWFHSLLRAWCARVAGLSLMLAGALSPALADPVVFFYDEPCDSTARPTDAGRTLPFDAETHHLIELLELSLSRWEPQAPASDLFAGTYSVLGNFVRLDVGLDGLVNPPGRTNPAAFAPFEFGPHPIYGFVEIDMDGDPQTGGEVDGPKYRYLGNVARFGGVPQGSEYAGRVAVDEQAFDPDFSTPPSVERHGEEFHLALLGGLFGLDDITEVEGDGDVVFEAGEAWNISAPLFHRAHGYEPFSLADGGTYAGEYSPEVTVRFKHHAETDVTIVSLVFPLNNLGAAAMRQELPEFSNGDPSDQASVLEGLDDLLDSALFVLAHPTSLAAEVLITPWALKLPTAHLDPTAWRATAVLGTSFTEPDPLDELFVWTDVYPNPIRGDLDGDGVAGAWDRDYVADYINDYDETDGQADGRVVVIEHAEAFTVCDINQDGRVDSLDEALVSLPGDLDNDGDLDLSDFAGTQACVTMENQDSAWGECALADLDADGDVDVIDAQRWVLALGAP